MHKKFQSKTPHHRRQQSALSSHLSHSSPANKLTRAKKQTYKPKPVKARAFSTQTKPFVPKLNPSTTFLRTSSTSNSPKIGVSETTTAAMSDSDSDYEKMKVYTKTGDKGTTALYNLQRLPKTSDYFDALGNVDEVNSQIGLAREYFVQIKKVIEWNQKNPELTEEERLDAVIKVGQEGHKKCPVQEIIDLDMELQIIQSRLLDLGSCIATPISSSPQNRLDRVAFAPENVDQLEKWIDQFDSKSPPLVVFILPSGGLAASSLHVARTIARRAERSVIPLVERGDCDEVVMRYLNRLSDYLFMAARYASVVDGKIELIYKKPTQRQLAKNAKETGLRANVLEKETE